MDIGERMAKAEAEINSLKEMQKLLVQGQAELRATMERGFAEERDARERGLAELRQEMQRGFRWMIGIQLSTLELVLGIIVRLAGLL